MAIRKNPDSKTPPKKAVAKNSASAKKNEQGSSFFQLLKVWICILLLLVLIGGIVFLLWQIPRQLLFDNPRLKLYRIEVQSVGSYWDDNRMNLLNIGGLRQGQSMFSIQVGKVRERMLQISSLADAEVQLSLPDMVVFKLREREPAARLGDNIFVDLKGVKFNRNESSKAKQTFPEITGAIGNERAFVKALELIDAANRDSQYIIAIREVRIMNSNALLVRLVYRHDRSFQVVFPTDRDFSDLFNKLNNTIRELYISGEAPGIIDLRNDGMVIMAGGK